MTAIKMISENALKAMMACQGNQKVIFTPTSGKYPGRMMGYVAGLFEVFPARIGYKFPKGVPVDVKVRLWKTPDGKRARLVADPINITAENIQQESVVIDNVHFFKSRHRQQERWIAFEEETGKVILISDKSPHTPTSNFELWKVTVQEIDTCFIALLLEKTGDIPNVPLASKKSILPELIEDVGEKTPDEQFEAAIRRVYTTPPSMEFPLPSIETILHDTKDMTPKQKKEYFTNNLPRGQQPPWQVMGFVNQDISLGELKKRYRQMIKTFHADHGATEADNTSLNMAYLWMQFYHCVANEKSFDSVDFNLNMVISGCGKLLEDPKIIKDRELANQAAQAVENAIANGK